jgi:ABC-type phosphate/phosphonate transport system ATPase subunit
MTDNLYQLMRGFVLERFAIGKVLGVVRDSSDSHLIEIIGKSGAGKSYLVEPLLEGLKKSFKQVHFFLSPSDAIQSVWTGAQATGRHPRQEVG